jgi:hypothetical protein
LEQDLVEAKLVLTILVDTMERLMDRMAEVQLSKLLVEEQVFHRQLVEEQAIHKRQVGEQVLQLEVSLQHTQEQHIKLGFPELELLLKVLDKVHKQFLGELRELV